MTTQMSTPAPRRPQGHRGDQRPAASIREAYQFFWPLIFTAELMMLSHSVIHGALARLPDAQTTLAAYSLAFYTHASLGSPFWASHLIGLAFIKKHSDLKAVYTFQALLVLAGSWFWLLLGLTPVGHFFFGVLLGAPPTIVLQAQRAMTIFWFNIPMAITRGMAYALLMIHKRTIYVTIGTAVRVLALFLLLYLLPRFTEGAVIGAAALAGCIGVETVYALWIAFPLYTQLSRQRGGEPTFAEIWHFAWPVYLIHAAENGVGFCINFFLGRLVRPQLALAAFGVLDGIIRVLLSPLRNLIPTIQTFAHRQENLPMLRRFSWQITMAFSALMLVFLLEAPQDFVLRRLLGVDAELQAYIAPALTLCCVLAFFHARASASRGMLIGRRRTGVIALSAVVRLGMVLLIGTLSLRWTDANGALLGMLSLIVAYLMETVVQSLKLRQLS